VSATNITPMKIAFIGLGQMGAPMAARLIAAGHELRVVDRSADALNAFTSANKAQVFSTPALAAEGVDVAITIVPTSNIVKDVILGSSGIASANRAPNLIIEMTSGQPAITSSIGQELAQKNMQLIDAPVSGGVTRARSGELAIMVGGEIASFARALPVLESMGKAITHVGELGSGQALKALNNLCSAAGLLIASEVVSVAQRFGLDADNVVDVLNASSGMNHALKTKFKPFVLSQTYGSGFSLDLMVKDIGIAMDLAQELKSDIPFAAACFERWKFAAKHLGAGRDHTEIARVRAELAGLKTLESTS
jgi:3-hydroxyisobutyrate dehydrogenase